MDKFPFIRCLNPKRILNPYTRESLVVECGHCPACSLRKSSVNAMKVKLESISHKYSMFVTLTYNNVSLPRMIVKAVNRFLDDCGEVCDSSEQFNLIDITQRLDTQGLILGRTPNYYHATEMLSKKVNLPKGILPHLSKYDAQLFIKRLRRNLDKYFLKTYGKKSPKIRYYLVGEYGPVHFRPHYHVILWFEDDEIYKVIRQILHQSWQFGRIDCQKSLGKCSDYVAKYLNCSVSLPDVFKGKQVRPFSIHSSHLGEKILTQSLSEVYEMEFESVISRRIPDFSTDSDVILWRSLKTWYYPKCKGYATKSKYQRLFAYKTYARTSTWTGETCIAKQARIILYTILNRFYHVDLADDMYYYDEDLIDYFEKSSLFDPWSFEHKSFAQHVDDVFRRIYMELRLSCHFHTNVCNGNVNLYLPMLEKIDAFWSNNDLYNLKNQCIQMEDYSLSDWFENEDEFMFFYHNVGFDIEKYKQCKAFRKFEQVTKTNSESAVKHKRLNDLNKKFESN